MMNGGPGDPPKKKTSYDYGDKMPSVHINPLISGSKIPDKYKNLIQSDRYKKETRTGPVAPPKQGELGYEKGSFLGNYIRK